jgi:Transcriptional regulator
MAKDTKERILAAALDMFSQNGYAGTNIRELSASLGLVKSGIYKHYESKEAIWNALLDQMIAYYEAHFGSSERLPPVPNSLEELTQMTMQMVNFTVHDGKHNHAFQNSCQYRSAFLPGVLSCLYCVLHSGRAL